MAQDDGAASSGTEDGAGKIDTLPILLDVERCVGARVRMLVAPVLACRRLACVFSPLLFVRAALCTRACAFVGLGCAFA